MANSFSMEDLLDFLNHAGDRGLIPAATARALAIASRNVFGVLSDEERGDLSSQDLAAVVKRFNNKRARDFNPSSLKEYGRRVNRAVELFLSWREDPANFSVKTRATGNARRKEKPSPEISVTRDPPDAAQEFEGSQSVDSYQTRLPVRPGVIITLSNVPHDLSKAEAQRLAEFVKMLAFDSSPRLVGRGTGK